MLKILWNSLFGELPNEYVNSKELRKILSNSDDADALANAIEDNNHNKEFTVTLSDNKKYRLKKSKTSYII